MFAMAPAFFGNAAALPLALKGLYANGTTNSSYSSDLTISGGGAPYSNPQVVSGSLPTGLSLSVVGNKLRLSGTTGLIDATSTFVVSVQDSFGTTVNSASQSVHIAVTDPNFANVVSLLHFDGTNGSTTFTDQIPKTWNAANTGQLSNTQAKYGATSLRQNQVNNGGYISANDAALALGTGDFDIEGYFWRTDNTARGIYNSNLSNSAAGIGLGMSGGASTAFELYNNGAVLTSATGLVTDGTWYHFCIERFGSSLKLYLNGTAIITTTTAVNITATQPSWGAYFNSNFCWLGYLDECRITKGVARYQGNFTPPSVAFPNS